MAKKKKEKKKREAVEKEKSKWRKERKGAKRGGSCEMNRIERYCKYRVYDLRWTE